VLGEKVESVRLVGMLVILMGVVLVTTRFGYPRKKPPIQENRL